MDLAERSQLQLEHQQQMLFKEFSYWRNNSNPGTAYAKHHSQIHRITNAIEDFLKSLPSYAPNDKEPFEQSSFRSNGLLYANHIWAFFRSMFALRQIDNYAYSLKRILDCADEFAWNCYEPARTRASQVGTIRPEDLKEPPLTFFASDAGPYIAQRKALFSVDGIKGRSQEFKQFNTALERLPVPIIGVPWLEAEHLPTAVVIAHEVGHLVERDFSTSTVFANSIMTAASIDGQRREHWRAWVSELFADTYAILCAGPAYVVALMKYLVAPERIVVHETLQQESAVVYPPRALRMAFNLTVLELLGLPHEGIKQLWNDVYPYSSLPEYEEYCQDAVLVAETLLKTPLVEFGGVPITHVINMTPNDWQAIKQRAQYLLDITSKQERPVVDAKDEKRFQHWFAVATWAYYTNPDAFMKFSVQHLLLEKLKSTITGVTRDFSPTSSPTRATATEKAGQVLLEYFIELEKVPDN